MANIEQTQQMVPSITCEVFLGKNVDKLVLGVDVFALDFGVQSDSIEQRIKRTLWVLATGLIVGLLPSMMILFTAWLSVDTCYEAS